MISLTRPSFTREEENALREAWRTRGEAACPRCQLPLSARPVERPDAVSYVRHRSWLTCPGCHRSVVADDPRRHL